MINQLKAMADSDRAQALVQIVLKAVTKYIGSGDELSTRIDAETLFEDAGLDRSVATSYLCHHSAFTSHESER